MIRVWPHCLLCLIAVLFAFTSCGCFPRTADDRRYYILDATRQGKPAGVRSDAVLRLRRFEVDAAFSTRQLVYRIEEFRYESDYYNQFLVSPGVMIMTETRDWLEDSGLFARVSATNGRLAAAYTLEGNVRALYADFTNKAGSMGIVEVRFVLLEDANAEGSAVLSRTYRATSPIFVRTAEAVVEAFSRSLQEILAQLENDMAKILARPTARGMDD
jgi:cholesterol transport system auxiliary component